MKQRITRALFGALLLTTALVATANAAWVYQPVKWTHPGLTSSQDGTLFANHKGFVRDTTWLPMAAAKVDTTAEFSLSDAELIGPAEYGRTSTTADTLVGAWVLLVADSNVASSVNWKNTTVTLQVNYGSGAGWQTAPTLTVTMTDGQKVLPIPLVASVPALTNDIPVDLTTPVLAFGAPRYRAIVTGGTSVAAPMTRVYVKKFIRGVQEFDKIQ